MHRVILLWCCAAFLALAALQTSYRLWLLQVGEAVVGEVTVAQDSCITRHRANCFLGRAVVNPRMANHKFKSTKISGGRFYDEGEELPMRVYPSEKRLYLAAVYTPAQLAAGADALRGRRPIVAVCGLHARPARDAVVVADVDRLGADTWLRSSLGSAALC